jgi:hypothetical protein
MMAMVNNYTKVTSDDPTLVWAVIRPPLPAETFAIARASNIWNVYQKIEGANIKEASMLHVLSCHPVST